jgi:hypothetical protein
MRLSGTKTQKTTTYWEFTETLHTVSPKTQEVHKHEIGAD